MAEKTISVKCEMNDKNKAAIKQALSDALKTDYSLWQRDSFEGKGGSWEFKIKINDSLVSNGYKIHVSYDPAPNFFLPFRAAVLGGSSFCLAFIISPILLRVIVFMLERIKVNNVRDYLADSTTFFLIIFLVVFLAVSGILFSIVDNPYKDMKKRLDSVEKELNM